MLARLTLLLLGALSAINAADAAMVAQDPVRVWATLSPEAIAVGETTILEIHLETKGEQADLITIPDLPPEIDVIRTSDYTQLQFTLPGGRSRIFRREIVLRANDPGTFQIPPVTARVQGSLYQTRELTLTVASQVGRSGGGTMPGSVSGAMAGPAAGPPMSSPVDGSLSSARGPRDEVILYLRMAPDTAYINQQITLRVQTWISEETQLRLRRAPEYHPPNISGFWTHDLPGPLQAGRRTFGDRHYRVQEFQRAYFPLTAGKFALPPARLVYEVRRSFLYANDEQSLATDSLKLVILPLPEEGRPTHFAGAVGNFSISARLEPAELPAGEATALVVEVEGAGNINALPPPWIPEVEGIELHPPGEDARTRVDQGRISGVKRFTWVLVPREVGIIEIPAIEYPYFDPELHQYRIATSDPLILRVQPGGSAAAPALATQPALAPLKTEPAGGAPLTWVRTPGFALALAAPLLAIALMLIPWRRLAHPRTGTARRRRRQRHAELIDLRRLIGMPGPEFFQSLDALIRGEIAVLVGSPTPARGAAPTLAAALEDHGVSPPTACAIAGLLTRIEGARYQPEPPGPEARAALLGEAERCLATLGRHGHASRPVRKGERKAPGPIAGVLLLLVLMAGGAGLVLSRADSAAPIVPLADAGENDLAGDRAGDLDARFRRAFDLFHADDFEGAARGFEALLNTSPRDPHLWYNLGNAEYQIGRRGPAIRAWLRALTLLPRDREIRFNLRLADVEPDLVHDASGHLPLTGEEMLFLAGVAWIAALIGLIAYLATRRRTAAHLGLAALALSVISFVVCLAPARHHTRAVALPDQLPLRVAPDHRAESSYYLDGGTRLRIVETRGEWLRVATGTGAEGWVEDRFAGYF